ncbi:hypothetical protein V8C86DRAFT_2609319 [Haematococcus lacustris]
MPLTGIDSLLRLTVGCALSSSLHMPGCALYVRRDLPHEFELDDSFSGLQDRRGLFTVAGFGSLLSITSARSTFPNLINFRPGKVVGWRRVFAHTADIFFTRGIARPDTGEISSLSLEPCPGSSVVVSLFQLPYNADTVAAFIAREQEFKFVAVTPHSLQGEPQYELRAVVCARWNDEDYKARRCPPEEWQRRWAPHGITRVWREDVLPCRVYLRHCVLASRSLGPEATESFLDDTVLADRVTSVRQWLHRHPSIMDEEPPADLVGRYSG